MEVNKRIKVILVLSILYTYSPCHVVILKGFIHSMIWGCGIICFQLKTILGVKKLSRIKILPFQLELRFDYYWNKSQSD